MVTITLNNNLKCPNLNDCTIHEMLLGFTKSLTGFTYYSHHTHTIHNNNRTNSWDYFENYRGFEPLIY